MNQKKWKTHGGEEKGKGQSFTNRSQRLMNESLTSSPVVHGNDLPFLFLLFLLFHLFSSFPLFLSFPSDFLRLQFTIKNKNLPLFSCTNATILLHRRIKSLFLQSFLNLSTIFPQSFFNFFLQLRPLLSVSRGSTWWLPISIVYFKCSFKFPHFSSIFLSNFRGPNEAFWLAALIEF